MKLRYTLVETELYVKSLLLKGFSIQSVVNTRYENRWVLHKSINSHQVHVIIHYYHNGWMIVE